MRNGQNLNGHSIENFDFWCFWKNELTRIRFSKEKRRQLSIRPSKSKLHVPES